MIFHVFHLMHCASALCQYECKLPAPFRRAMCYSQAALCKLPAQVSRASLCSTISIQAFRASIVPRCSAQELVSLRGCPRASQVVPRKLRCARALRKWTQVAAPAPACSACYFCTCRVAAAAAAAGKAGTGDSESKRASHETISQDQLTSNKSKTKCRGPQRERADKRMLPRGSHNDSHGAAARAIRHAISPRRAAKSKFAWGHSEGDPTRTICAEGRNAERRSKGPGRSSLALL